MRRLALAAAVFALLACPVAARAADVTVNITGDDDDGLCQLQPVGDCSFREAIKYSAAGDTVTVPAGDYSLEGDGQNFGGHVDVAHDLTIVGAGRDETTIHGRSDDRVMIVSPDVGTDVSGLTIADGDAGDGNGGGIWVRTDATLLLFEAAVVRNGGWDGAGIFNEGTAEIVRSVVASNSAFLDGGGMYSSGTVTLDQSTVAGNEAVNDGAGLYVLGGDASLTNSTLSRNIALNNGGGMFVGTNVDLANVTIADNEAESGGGIQQQVDTQTTDSTNTVIARNSGGSCSGTTGAMQSVFTMSDDVSCIPGGDPSNHLVADPRLGTLADNGGPTRHPAAI